MKDVPKNKKQKTTAMPAESASLCQIPAYRAYIKRGHRTSKWEYHDPHTAKQLLQVLALINKQEPYRLPKKQLQKGQTTDISWYSGRIQTAHVMSKKPPHRAPLTYRCGNPKVLVHFNRSS